MSQVRAGCCIVGGGPAGMMAAMLFARAGVQTILLEKHADFLRDFHHVVASSGPVKARESSR